MAYDDTALRTALELGAWTIAAAGAGLLLLACTAEIVRRIRDTSRLVSLADRVLPTASRRVAVVVVTVVSAWASLVAPSGAGAEDDLRSWLTDQPAASTSEPPTSTTTLAPPSMPAVTTSTTAAPMTTTTVPQRIGPASARRADPPRAAAVLRPRVAPKAGALEPTPVEVPPPLVISAPPPPMPSPDPAPTMAAVGPTHTVVAGECLWSIAEHALGAGATARAVDRGWRAIYDANRGAIGTDPNLIHPGLVLVLPPLDPTP